MCDCELISYIIYKIREGVTNAIGNKHSSQHVICTRRKMLQKFNGIFGTRVEGALGEDHLTEGPNSFMASLLDPRMKGGEGLQQRQIEQEEQQHNIEEEQEHQHHQYHHTEAIDNMFDELNAHYIEEQERVNNNNNNE